MALDLEQPICKLSKSELNQCVRMLAREVGKTRYICLKCARLSPYKQQLCKAKPVHKVAKVEG